MGEDQRERKNKQKSKRNCHAYENATFYIHYYWKIKTNKQQKSFIKKTLAYQTSAW